LPGLIVDSYGPVLSIQITTAGMEKLKPIVLETLVESLHPISIYEKSSSAARQMEGLSESIGLLYGNLIDHVEIEENGMRFTVSIVNGQKTGFFLDQREMRSQIAKIAKGKRVLNCFSYTGGFSLAALKGGALHVDSVDISKEACQLCDVNCQEFANHTSIQADVFNFLNQSALNYDLVILDPPAFAKKRSDLINACKGYKEINRKVIEKVPSSCILVTSSCSSYMDDSLFQNVLSQAASEANRFVRRIGSHIQAPDHPVSLFHPEGHYLKSQILIIY
jgi:23S rRNA (cytosine1962-C5)-methyltransferase